MAFVPTQVFQILNDVWDSTNHWLQVSISRMQVVLSNGAENDSIGAAAYRRPDAFQTLPILVHSASAVDLKAATASKKIYVTDLLISIDASGACDLIIQDSTGTPVQLARMYLPAAVTTIPIRLNTPLVCGTNTKLQALASSGTPNIYVTAAGYLI